MEFKDGTKQTIKFKSKVQEFECEATVKNRQVQIGLYVTLDNQLYLTFKIPVSNNGEVDIEKAEQIIRDKAPELAITEIIECERCFYFLLGNPFSYNYVPSQLS